MFSWRLKNLHIFHYVCIYGGMPTLDRKENSLQDRIYISEQWDCESKQLFLLLFQTLHIFLFDLERKQHFPSNLGSIYHTNPHTSTHILQHIEIRDDGDRGCVCVYEKARETKRKSPERHTQRMHAKGKKY